MACLPTDDVNIVLFKFFNWHAPSAAILATSNTTASKSLFSTLASVVMDYFDVAEFLICVLMVTD